MTPNAIVSIRRSVPPGVFRWAWLAAAALVPVGHGGLAAQFTVSRPVFVGQRYFLATHSLNDLIGPSPRPAVLGSVDALATEAELSGNQRVGVQVIDGGTPAEHWSQGGGDERRNPAKAAIRAGLDLFVISPMDFAGLEGLGEFSHLMMEANPTGRVLYEIPWSACGGADGPAGGYHREIDARTLAAWNAELQSEQSHVEHVRGTLAALNADMGHPMTHMIPTATAVCRLLLEVAEGKVPGVRRQADLFTDAGGVAPRSPIENLVTYVWFATMYRQVPGGLTVLYDRSDPSSPERERMLQRLAWQVVYDEPLSGLTGLSERSIRLHQH